MIDENTAWCGIDISKNTFDAGYHPACNYTEFSKIPTKPFPRNRAGIQIFHDWVETQRGDNDYQIRVIMEATGRYSLETAKWILADYPDYQPAIVNPRHSAAFHVSLGLRNKTDKIDCRALAKMGKERNPPSYQPLSPIRESFQALTRQRVAFVEERTAAKNRRAETLDSPFIKKLQDQHLDHLDKAINRIENELTRLAKKDDRIQHDMKLLRSIPGVGLITAVTVIAELGDLNAFQCSRQLASMVGVSPRIQTSGKSVQKRPRMSKQGNVHVRAVLYMAARTAAIHNIHMAVVYRRLREKGKSHNCALGAVMRKLLLLMRSLTIGRNYYDPSWDPKTVVTRPVEKLSKTNPKLRLVPL